METFVALQLSWLSHTAAVLLSQSRNVLSRYFIEISPFLFCLHSCLAWSLKTLMKSRPRPGVGLYMVCTSSVLNCLTTSLEPLEGFKHWILCSLWNLSQKSWSRNCRHWQISRPSFIQLKFLIHSEISLCESFARTFNKWVLFFKSYQYLEPSQALYLWWQLISVERN